MTFPRKSIVAILIIFVSAAFAGDDAKKCTSTARECEQQIRKMMSGRRYLGAQLVDLHPGIIVKSVVPDGPAERADFREGDRLIAINGHDLTNSGIKEFKEYLGDAKETGKLWVIVQRRGSFKKIDVRLEPYTKAQIDKIVAQHLSQSHSAGPGPTQP
ncbi:MAG TPA: PDZ domain-containing protein [Thermoanaerobaculia bacterium]|nr:PDZ domain-containing protein [Thermoanaerobaculia bacterium]